jgi:hypothetical protein
VPRDHDAIDQLGHHFRRHFTGFFDNLIKRHRHGRSLA